MGLKLSKMGCGSCLVVIKIGTSTPAASKYLQIEPAVQNLTGVSLKKMRNNNSLNFAFKDIISIVSGNIQEKYNFQS